MPLLTFDDKNASFSKLMNFVNDVKKEMSKSEALRPSLGRHQSGQGYGGTGGMPNYRINNYQLEHLANQSDIFMISIKALRKKIFRRGFRIDQKSKLPSDQIKILNSIMTRINKNNQSLKDVLSMYEDDLNIYDDGYLIAIQEYIFGLDGDIVGSNTEEMIVAEPSVMAIIADREGRLGYNMDGQMMYVSMSDRSVAINESQAEKQGFRDKDGIKLQPTYYKSINSTGESGKETYYIPGEVLHLSAHSPTMTYGKSPIGAIWMKMVTLIEQDRFLLLNYQKGRPPRGILSFQTSNFAGTKASWEHLKEEARTDPHAINPILLEGKDGGSGVTWTNLMEPLADMEFVESRNEFRRSIGATFGVMPLFSGDLSQSGGLNNEGLQINVTSQAVQDKQELYNEKALPWILEKFGVTDYSIILEEPEEKDAMIEAQLFGVEIDNAVKMSGMGFDVSYDEEAETFNYSEQAITPSDQFNPFNKPADTDTSPGEPNIEKDYTKIVANHYPVRMKGKDPDKEIKKQIIDLSEIKKKDNSLLDFLKKQLFDKSYQGLSKQLSNKVNSILLSGISSDDKIIDIKKKIEKLGIDSQQAELITRSEHQILQNAGREFNFLEADTKGTNLYKWAGPNDKRTADVSKEIKKKSAKGLPLEELKTLVRKTAEKFGFKPTRDWQSHPNSRHFFIRKF